jgi:uncharacterized protein (TIGR03790 family)
MVKSRTSSGLLSRRTAFLAAAAICRSLKALASLRTLGPSMILRIALIILFSAPLLFSQTADNVLLVVNENSPISIDVGMYYAQKRGIPKSNILRIRVSDEDNISREDFDRRINSPIASWLSRNFAQDRILYIVLTKGVPLRINGTSGIDGTMASVDSELTLLYRRMLGYSVPPAGRVKNPYFLNDAPVSTAKPFDHTDHDIYLVSRLDGYNVADIRGLIDRGYAPSRQGNILLDSKGSTTEKGDSWLLEAADVLGKMGFKDRVVLDTTSKVLTGTKQVLGYYSWGSNDPAIRVRHFGFEFLPGALAGMFVSSDGRTFREPPGDWKIGGSWSDKSALFAGSPQSLAGDLIHEGVTGIAGHVAEPFLDATIRPNILFPAYLSGFNLIESYYLAMPYLSWQTVIVGDPLCAPFRTTSLSAGEIDKGLDPDTELPASFGTRRLRAMSQAAFRQSGVHPDTIRWLVRSEARLARQDQAGARQALEQAVARDDRLPAPQLLLASMYEVAREYDKAIERYRRLLEILPDNAMVLNNLAYALAVRKNNVQEALPLAEKAHELAKDNANVSDTLGWIYHLTGQDAKAGRLLGEAVKSAAPNPQMHLHFAVVSAAIGDKLAAEVALQRALELDPKLEQSEEVKQLRAKLKQ